MEQKNIARIAVATEDGIHVNVHFGQISELQIIDLRQDGTYEVIESRPTPAFEDYPQRVNQMGCRGHNEEYVTAVAHVIKDCQYFLLEKIGGHPSRVFLREGIETLEHDGSIEENLKILAAFLSKRQGINRKEGQ